MPIRVQRKRTKGWRMPPDTVYVGRPSKWGNPFVVGEPNPYIPDRQVEDRRHAYNLYVGHAPLQARLFSAAMQELRGKDLACWCPLDQPCHADMLLEVVNFAS